MFFPILFAIGLATTTAIPVHQSVQHVDNHLLVSPQTTTIIPSFYLPGYKGLNIYDHLYYFPDYPASYTPIVSRYLV
ncbi:Hypothetical protein NTJ_00621 [Nesidiocoris tenuis]|uniref:Uncharacterized protein n=1 Tax=Nesidiocoris tenuis TaxID=355587 RepID=A0ABN7A6S8_9HEMI|nr:Hypothetical protein NTJ_00621 [Nesidiocoris tenuis]